MTGRRSRRAASPGTPMRSRLVLRAIGWRLASSIAFFAVAAVAIAAAAAGPFYLTAADRSILAGTLGAAQANQIGITISQPAGSTQGGAGPLLAAAADIPGGMGSARQDRFAPPIITTDVATSIYSPVAGRADSIQFIARTGACAAVRFTAGHCPTAADEVALSGRTAAQLRVGIGGTVKPLASAGSSSSGSSGRAAAHLVVSGLYAPGDPAAPIWWGENYFAFGAPSGSGSNQQLDPGWVTPAGAHRLGAAILSATHVTAAATRVQVPLRPASIVGDNPAGLVDQLAAWEAHAQATNGVNIGSNLPSVLATAETEQSSARTVVFVVSPQLALLALLVLYIVARATSALRAGDVRVAELRGLPRRSVAGLALREPVLLLAAALPAGIALGWAAMTLIDTQLLSIAVPRFDALVFAAAGGAFAAGVISAVLGSRALLRVRVAEESLDEATKRRARNASVLDSLGLALAAAGCAQLIAGGNRQAGSANLLALLGPGLIALGAGILAARLLPLVAKAITRATRWSGHVTAALAARSVGRREDVARRAFVPTIASGLLVFSVAGLAVARRNDAMQANFQVGAPVVLRAQVSPGADFLAGVRAADPGGKEAMAVVEVTANYGSTLAVDSSRLAALGAWPKNLSAVPLSAIAAALRPPTAPVVTIPAGDRLVLRADLSTVIRPRPDLQLSLYDEQSPAESTVDFGLLRPGLHTYSVSLAGACPAACRLDGFGILWNGSAKTNPAASAVHIRLEQLRSVAGRVSRTVRAGFGDAAAWRSGGVVSLRSSPAGLGIVVDLATATTPPTIVPADVPVRPPAVVTSGFAAFNRDPVNPGLFPSVGLDGAENTVHEIAEVEAIPRLGGDGTMIDLGFAQSLQTGSPAGATFEVWCRHPPSQALLARLGRRGVSVVGSDRSATLLRRLQRSGASLGFDLFGLAGVGALLLALGALLFATSAGARARGVELAGLAAAGVPRRTLRLSVVAESLMVSTAGAVLGWAAGILGASLTIGSLPEFAPGRIGPPLELGLPWLALAGGGAAVLAALVAAALASAAVVMRQVRPDTLRTSA